MVLLPLHSYRNRNHVIKDDMTKKILTTSIIFLLTLIGGQLPVGAQQNRDYSDEHPLIIVCDWDFPPYEFSNNNGEPDGFNVQILSTILKQLKIPYKFQTKEWMLATTAFENREADLIFDPTYRYHERPYVRSQTIFNYYKVKIAMNQERPPVTHLSELGAEDTLVLKSNDYVTNRIVEERQLDIPIEYHSPKNAIAGIANNKYEYFIWGEEPLKWKLKELQLDDVELYDIDIPDGEIRIVGYDWELINAIDNGYARLEQSGELEKIRDTWFHPERIHNDTSPIALFILIGAGFLVVVFVLLSRLLIARVRVAVGNVESYNYMMMQALRMGSYYVTEYEVETGRLKNVYGEQLPKEGITLQEFVSHIHEEDQADFQREIDRMLKNDNKQATLKIRWNAGTPEAPIWRYLQGHTIAETEKGKIQYIVNVLKDTSKEVEEDRANNEMKNRYMQMFDTNLVAMSFYDRHGKLIDLNENMKKLCEFDDVGEEYFRTTNLFDITFFKELIGPDDRDEVNVCEHMQYPSLGIDKFVEICIHPAFEEDDLYGHYVVTARDITQERTMYVEQCKHDKEIRRINKIISGYEEQLHYLLEHSDMYAWHADYKTRMIHFSRSLSGEAEFSRTLEEYLTMMADEERDMQLMRTSDYWSSPINNIHYFKEAPISGKPAWCAFSGVPIRDKDGNLTGQFGVMRDVTQLIEAQEKLKQETTRAEESGTLKSTFLSNMAHEIRTPLNAIVGFSDLLTYVDTREERMEFTRIIRNNCSMLMRLIDDILEASNMGQALSIEPAEVDFSIVFDDICQTLAQRVEVSGVPFVKDNPYTSLVTTLDKGRIQQVLTNFTTNAVKYTHEGHIKVGYRCERRVPTNQEEETDGLYFYCEDTGAGIPKEKQASVFERFVKLNDFVQGTGLGLSICHTIATRCHGSIGVMSEGEGHGSTFWMWIPCEIKVRKDVGAAE